MRLIAAPAMRAVASGDLAGVGGRHSGRNHYQHDQADSEPALAGGRVRGGHGLCDLRVSDGRGTQLGQVQAAAAAAKYTRPRRGRYERNHLW